MANRAKTQGQRAGGAQTGAERAGQVASGVVHLVTSTVVTALVGARDVGAEVGSVAVTAVRGSIRAAGEIGADVGRLARSAATGAIDAADRITAAAGRAADNLVDNTMSVVAGIVRGVDPPDRPATPAAGQPPNATGARAAAYSDGRVPAPSQTSGRSPVVAARKPLARTASRVARPKPARRGQRRRGAA